MFRRTTWQTKRSLASHEQRSPFYDNWRRGIFTASVYRKWELRSGNGHWIITHARGGPGIRCRRLRACISTEKERFAVELLRTKNRLKTESAAAVPLVTQFRLS